MRYKTVIFDFDGTICDTGEGILKSAKFALDYYNIEAPNYTELTYFIGPPLLVTFQEKFGVDAAMADKLVKKYRERYTNKGLLESKLYDGIKELLAKLKAENLKLGIASSKPQDYIEALLDHYGVKSYFDVICGVTFSADCESKANIISRCLKELDASGNESIMVGDKKYDIEGAKANMIDSVGVLWGYGNRVEFAGAGAKFVAEKIDDIFSIALGYFEQTQEVQGIFSGRIILNLWIGKLHRVSQSIFSHTAPLVKMISEPRNAAGVPGLHFYGRFCTIFPSISWATCHRRLSQRSKISAVPAQKGCECFFRS